MKSQLVAPVAAVLLLVSSGPLFAVPHREAPTLDWTAMVGTGGITKPVSADAPTQRARPDWTSKIGTGTAAESNSGSKAQAVLASTGSVRVVCARQ